MSVAGPPFLDFMGVGVFSLLSDLSTGSLRRRFSRRCFLRTSYRLGVIRVWFLSFCRPPILYIVALHDENIGSWGDDPRVEATLAVGLPDLCFCSVQCCFYLWYLLVFCLSFPGLRLLFLFFNLGMSGFILVHRLPR